MGIQDLQSFLEGCQIEGSCVGVDLVRIARTIAQKWAKQIYKKGPHGSGKFSLVVDAECCLDRLYGGFFSDWVCGGQWNRVTTFLGQFVSSLNVANIEIVVFFNGCTEQSRTQEWIQGQLKNRNKISQVLRHLSNKGTPPPKVWWTPPCCLRPTLRMVLRNFNVPVVVTMDDHKQEVIAYCRENNCHAIVADDAEYIAFEPPRYFSARHLKLTYKGTLESKEYIISELTKGLGVTTEQLAVVAALLGNYLLPETDLVELHRRIINGYYQHKVAFSLDSTNATSVSSSTTGQSNSGNNGGGMASGNSGTPAAAPGTNNNTPAGSEAGWDLVHAVAWYVRSLNASSTSDLDRLCQEVFGSAASTTGESSPASRLKQAVQYYLDGTKNGFLRYRSSSSASGKKGKKGNVNKNEDKAGHHEDPSSTGELDTSRLASEAVPNELAGLISSSEAAACLSVGPEIIVDMTFKESNTPETLNQHAAFNGSDVNCVGGPVLSMQNNGSGVNHSLLLNNASSSGNSSSSTSPSRTSGENNSATNNTALPAAPVSAPNATAGVLSHKNKPHVRKTVRLLIEEEKITLPPVAAEIMRTVSERHTKGLMSPLIYQILTQGEIKLPVLMEDETNKDFPSIQVFYRPMRQMVYAILFNLHHHTYMAKNNKDKTPNHDAKLPEIKIKEWVWSKQNPYQKPEIVRAEPLGWGVPTIQRLWFGTTVDDKRRRLRAYLTCMRSDTQLMLNPSYVPQHLLVLATVLRYIMSFSDKRVLRKHELDALIATAMDPHLPNSEYNQELQVDCISGRAVQVGALVMAGVEYALLVNDACGAPIPWLMVCPWLYFDGKLLAAHLARAATAKNLPDLCSHRVPQIVQVERMREAVLEGMYVQWARPPLLPQLSPVEAARVHSVMPAGMPGSGGRTSIRGATLPPGVRGRGVTTGGRLEIAGVVVGNWGPNCRLHPDVILPPQVTSVGGLAYSGSGGHQLQRGGGSGGGGGGGGGGRPTYNTRTGSVSAPAAYRTNVKGRGMKPQGGGGKKRSVGGGNGVGKKENRKQPKGRGFTVTSPLTGEIVEASELSLGGGGDASHGHLQLHHQANKGPSQHQVNSSHHPEVDQAKRILTNSENKKMPVQQQNRNMQRSQQSGAGNQGILVNGNKAVGSPGPGGDAMIENSEQFEDASSITAGGSGMRMHAFQS